MNIDIPAPSFDLSHVPEHDRDRIAAMIPDPRIASAYVHRDVFGMEDFSMLDYATAQRENVLLSGPTGSSKTTVFRAYAASRGLPFVDVECNGAMDPGTIIGRTTIDPDGSVAWMDGDLTAVIRYGGVAVIDEINLAHPRITAAFHGVLSVMRRMSIPENGEIVRAGHGGAAPQPLLFGAAYNPRYQGAMRLNEALANRFAVQIEWDYDRAVESRLIPSARLLDTADTMRGLAEIRTPVSTNALMEFVKHAAHLGYPAASALFVGRFAPEERAPVRRAMDANAQAILSELGDAFISGGAR